MGTILTIFYIDGVDAAQALGAAHNETVAEFKPGVALSEPDIRDITLVAQTRDNATTIGGLTPEQLAYCFARMILPSKRSSVEHIYLLASEAGMRQHGQMSLAQRFMEAMAAKGFINLQVHAIVSPGVPTHGMGIEVVTDRRYSCNREPAGYVNGFYYRDEYSHEVDIAIFKARDAAEETRMRKHRDWYHNLILARKNDRRYQSNKITIFSTGNYKETMQQPCYTLRAGIAEPMMSPVVSYAIHYLCSQKPSQKRFLDYIHNDLLALRAKLDWGITEIINELQKHKQVTEESLYYRIVIVPLEAALQEQNFSIIQQPAGPVIMQPGKAAAGLQAHGFFSAPSGAYELTLREKLEEYKALRESEWWGFHYNFLGLISVVYFISDYLCGTDYFNSKHREIKKSAVTKLLGGEDLVNFTEYEVSALSDGRLGKIVADNGGLEVVIPALWQEFRHESGPRPTHHATK